MPINIATAIDSLVELVKTSKKISLEDAARKLDLPETIINEWATFLEEEGIIQITYKFTTPYLEVKEKSELSDDEENLKRRLDISTRKLELILTRLKVYKIEHRYEIKSIQDVRDLLKKHPDETSKDYIFAQKYFLEFRIKALLDAIKKIKLLTPDLIKYLEKRIEDLEVKKIIFIKNYENLK